MIYIGDWQVTVQMTYYSYHMKWHLRQTNDLCPQIEEVELKWLRLKKKKVTGDRPMSYIEDWQVICETDKLQCVVVWCSVLQCVAVGLWGKKKSDWRLTHELYRRLTSHLWDRQVAVCCSVMQRVAVGCSGLQRVAVGCSGLQCVAVCWRHRRQTSHLFSRFMQYT